MGWREDHDDSWAKIMDIAGPELVSASYLTDVYDLFDSLEIDSAAGDKSAPLKVIHLCVGLGLSVPEWAKHDFVQACDDGYGGKLKSWDEAFDHPNTPGKVQRDDRDKDFDLQVYEAVEAARGTTPIDDTLFAQIGRDMGIGGKTLVKRLYREVKERTEDVKAELDEFDPRESKIHQARCAFIYCAVGQTMSTGRRLDDSVFAEVGGYLNIDNVTDVKRLYEMVATTGYGLTHVSSCVEVALEVVQEEEGS